MLMMRLICHAVLVLLLTLFITPILATAKDGWKRIQTTNFTLVSNAGERDMQRIATEMEFFRSTRSATPCNP